MVKKRIIRKLLVLAAWMLVIAGLCTLLVAANRKEKDHLCREIRIGIRGAGEKYYIEKEDVLKLMTAVSGGLTGRPVSTMDLARLEKSLENNAWIREAELYIDSRDVLHVAVYEREPIARVFTTAGNSFYIDSSGHRMPLMDKLSARVPVVTGYPDIRRMSAADSALLAGVKNVAAYIYSDPFWSAQIGQVDITPERRFELIPVVGDHIIRLGDGTDVEARLRKLYVFYQQVLSKTGFDKYAVLDVQFNGQVVAVKKGPASAVDSIQLQKNIEELVNRAVSQQANDTLTEAAPQRPIDTTIRTNTVPARDTARAATTTAATPAVTTPVRTTAAPPKPAARTTPPARRTAAPARTVPRPPAATNRTPRAVMPRRRPQ